MAKKLKIKLPKRIGGLKIPKTVRKGPIAKFLNSGPGQIVMAQALVGAAAAFTAAKSDAPIGDIARHPLKHARRARQELTKAGTERTDRLSFAIGEAAHAFKAAMESGPSHDDEWEAGKSEIDAEVEPIGKKKQPRTESSAAH